MNEHNTSIEYATYKPEVLFGFFKSIQEGTSPPTVLSPWVIGNHRHKEQTNWLEVS